MVSPVTKYVAPEKSADGDRIAAVSEGHRVQHLLINDRPTLEVPAETKELRWALIEEEAAEFRTAIEAEDLVEVADAIGDLLYVVYGAALTFGIPVAEVFTEVHRSNMTKLDDDGQPVVRADGKVMKGPNFSHQTCCRCYGVTGTNRADPATTLRIPHRRVRWSGAGRRGDLSAWPVRDSGVDLGAEIETRSRRTPSAPPPDARAEPSSIRRARPTDPVVQGRSRADQRRSLRAPTVLAWCLGLWSSPRPTSSSCGTVLAAARSSFNCMPERRLRLIEQTPGECPATASQCGISSRPFIERRTRVRGRPIASRCHPPGQ